jgi:hypothetical protein
VSDVKEETIDETDLTIIPEQSLEETFEGGEAEE